MSEDHKAYLIGTIILATLLSISLWRVVIVGSIKAFWKWWTREQKKLCPHCGYYCRGKSIFCLPPKPQETNAD